MIRGDKPLGLGEWHKIELTRSLTHGKMTVNDEDVFEGTVHGRHQGLDLLEPLYVGGHPNFHAVHKLAGHSQGFVGKCNAVERSFQCYYA